MPQAPARLFRPHRLRRYRPRKRLHRKANDTLSLIAASCGTTAEKPAAYNGISDANTLHNGQQINLPPAEYTLPAENVVSSTASDAGQTESTGSSGAQTSLSENGADTSSDSADS